MLDIDLVTFTSAIDRSTVVLPLDLPERARLIEVAKQRWRSDVVDGQTVIGAYRIDVSDVLGTYCLFLCYPPTRDAIGTCDGCGAEGVTVVDTERGWLCHDDILDAFMSDLE